MKKRAGLYYTRKQFFCKYAQPVGIPHSFGKVRPGAGKMIEDSFTMHIGSGCLVRRDMAVPFFCRRIAFSKEFFCVICKLDNRENG